MRQDIWTRKRISVSLDESERFEFNKYGKREMIDHVTVEITTSTGYKETVVRAEISGWNIRKDGTLGQLSRSHGFAEPYWSEPPELHRIVRTVLAEQGVEA